MKQTILRSIVTISLTSLVLSGCASSGTIPNKGDYKPAVNVSSSAGMSKKQDNHGKDNSSSSKHSSKPEKVAAGIKSKTIKPKHIKQAKHQKGKKAVNKANKSSVRKPKSLNYLNSIMTYRFEKGAIYQVYTAPLQVTDVQFQPGEHIISIAAGDTLRWQVSKTYSGSGKNEREHLLIKPNHPGIKNSVVIMTNLRNYHLELISTKNTYMNVVNWQYPNQSFVNHYKSSDSQGSVLNGLNLSSMQFNYQIQIVDGSKPDWMPQMVFTDGDKTYIKFPPNMQEAPVLFLTNDSGTGHIVNYRVQGNYYVVDTVISRAQLRLGQPAQTVVQISRVNND